MPPRKRKLADSIEIVPPTEATAGLEWVRSLVTALEDGSIDYHMLYSELLCRLVRKRSGRTTAGAHLSDTKRFPDPVAATRLLDAYAATAPIATNIRGIIADALTSKFMHEALLNTAFPDSIANHSEKTRVLIVAASVSAALVEEVDALVATEPDRYRDCRAVKHNTRDALESMPSTTRGGGLAVSTPTVSSGLLTRAVARVRQRLSPDDEEPPPPPPPMPVPASASDAPLIESGSEEESSDDGEIDF